LVDRRALSIESEALGVEFDPSNADMVQRIAEILGFSVIDTTLL